jgi:hypothetical protein
VSLENTTYARGFLTDQDWFYAAEPGILREEFRNHHADHRAADGEPDTGIAFELNESMPPQFCRLL